jgi:hypothetical protein
MEGLFGEEGEGVGGVEGGAVVVGGTPGVLSRQVVMSVVMSVGRMQPEQVHQQPVLLLTAAR